MSEELSFAKELAREAGEIMKRYFRSEELGLEFKDDHSPLTVADTTINEMVISRIREAYPEDSILGEEESYMQDDSEYTWVCDPIDGTRPFMLGAPTSVFSLARTIDGQPVLAVVYDPFTDSLYSAVKGEGAFMNERRISVNDAETLDVTTIGSTVSRHTPYTVDIEREIIRKQSSVVNFGSAVYMGVLVARGSLTAYFFPLENPWDAAAVKLLVEEAGGTVTSLSGEGQRYDESIDGFLATNGQVHAEFVHLIADIRK